MVVTPRVALPADTLHVLTGEATAGTRAAAMAVMDPLVIRIRTVRMEDMADTLLRIVRAADITAAPVEVSMVAEDRTEEAVVVPTEEVGTAKRELIFCNAAHFERRFFFP
jgi:hypothetical protein